ncbi:MAG: amine dehydrogenase large subunit, partial [Myxococcota bacterium]
TDGQLANINRSEGFFDVIKDPIAMAGARVDHSWFFVSFGGQVYEIDFSGDQPRPQEPWPLASHDERSLGWRPGGLQHVAIHRSTRRLYVLMHQGIAGSHKDAGPEIWVHDLETKRRINRFDVPNLTADFLGPLLGIATGSLTDRLLHWATSTPGAHAIAVTQDEQPLLFARNADIGSIAVLDAKAGTHLRNLEEAGLMGPTLGVP